MIDKQQFIKATDFLKEHYKLTFGEMAESIDEKEHAITNVRRGSKKPNASLVDKLRKQYPQLESFFATNVANDDIANDSMIMVSDGRAWKELADTQRKLLEALELRIAKQEEEFKELKAENSFLLKKVMELEKKTV